MLKQEKIPKGVIEELSRNYVVVDFSNYNGILTEDVLSLKLRYRDKINSTQEQVYIVRGVWTDNTAKIYAVLEAGIVRGSV